MFCKNSKGLAVMNDQIPLIVIYMNEQIRPCADFSPIVVHFLCMLICVLAVFTPLTNSHGFFTQVCLSVGFYICIEKGFMYTNTALGELTPLIIMGLYYCYCIACHKLISCANYSFSKSPDRVDYEEYIDDDNGSESSSLVEDEAEDQVQESIELAFEGEEEQGLVDEIDQSADVEQEIADVEQEPCEPLDGSNLDNTAEVSDEHTFDLLATSKIE